MEQLMTVRAAKPGADRRRAGIWRWRFIEPLAGFLAQGLSPAQLSQAIAVAAVCGVFPFLGATTLLTFGAGLALRLNQPAMQAVNYLLSPVQLVLIPVFVRLGAWMLGANAGAFSLVAMLAVARDGSVGDFLVQFGRAGWYAFVAWLVVAPGLYVVVRVIATPLLNRLAASRAGGGGRA